MLRRFVSVFTTCCTVAISPLIMAQPAGALGDDFVHRIQLNDTLIGLSNLYTRNSANWTTIQRHNAIADPSKLAIGYQLRIPFTLISAIPAPTTAVHVSGKAEIDGVPLRTGMPVTEGATVTTATDAFVTLQLSDGTKLTLPRGGYTQLERLRQFEGLGLTDSIVVIEQGEIDSDVAPTGKGVGRFEIRTPVAIIGVRGTRFRVHVAEEGSRSEVLAGVVDLQTPSTSEKPTQRVSLPSGHGATISPDGSLQIQPLLPPPVVGIAQRAGAGQWTAHVTPVLGAVGYLVQVSRDADGMDVISSQKFDNADIRFSARRSGTHYASVRAINAAGLGGGDTYVAFEGTSGLISSSGAPITLSDGSVVALTDY